MPGRGNRRFFHFTTAAAPFVAQQVSVDFDGSSEYMVSDLDNDTTIGVANTWSCAVWYKPQALTALMDLFRFQLGSENAIEFEIAGATANDPLRVFTADSAGLTIKDYRWDSLVSTGTWYLTVFTWDGTTLKLHHQGVDQGAPDNAFTDNAGTMADSARNVSIGAAADTTGKFEGRIHSIGVWDAVLSESEAAVLYNAGAGAAVNWNANSGAYTHSANLQHWWRVGNDSADIGKDSGNNATTINALNATYSSGIDATDIVADFPS